VDKKGGADELHAVYAPPAPARDAPSRSQQGFARGAFGAAFRTQRRAPLRAFLLLGLLPGLWSLPADLLLAAGQSDGTSFDWAIQGRDAGFSLLHSLWAAVALGGQTLVALVLANGGSATLRDLASGIRFAPAMFAILAAGALWTHALLVLMAAGLELGGAWAAFGLPVALLMLLATIIFIVPWSIVGYPVVERRKGLVDAIGRTIEVLRGAWWGFARLTLLTMLWFSPLVSVLCVDSPRVSALVSALVLMLLGPTLFLVWAHAYLCAGAESATGQAGPSVAAEPRP
jgi:hypothetical protein